MAFGNDNMLFGSEFDPSGIVKGAAVIVENLTKVEGAQTSLNQTLEKGAAQMATAGTAAEKFGTSIGHAGTELDKIREKANTPIVPKLNDTEINKTLQVIRDNFNKTLTGLDFSNFEELENKLKDAKDEFEELNIVIEEAKKKLATLDTNSQEFADLNKVVQVGTQMLKDYNKATDQTEGKTKSLKARLKELRDEMTRLEDVGQDNTETYKKLQNEAAKLTDQYGDMQSTIRILASDTKGLDFGLAAANAAASGFQLITGAMALFGVESKEAQAVQTKLLAVMNLVQGAQQLQNLLLKESTLRVVATDLVTKLYAATQRVLAVSLNVSAGAARTLSAALITTGVGALVVALGFLINYLSTMGDESEEAAAAQEDLSKAIDNVTTSIGKNIETIEFLGKVRTEKLKQAGLSDAVVQQNNLLVLQQKYAEYTDAIADLDDKLANTQVADKTKLYTEIFKLEDERQKVAQEITLQGEQNQTKIIQDENKKRKDARDKAAEAAKAALEAALKLQQQIAFELLLRNKSAEEQELIKLTQKYDADKAVLLKAHQSIKQLNELFEAQKLDIVRKYNQLTEDEIRKFDDELLKASFDAATARAENLTNEFERQKALITVEFNKASSELQERQTSLLNAALTDKNNNVISEAEYNNIVERTNATFDRLFFELSQSVAEKKKELAARIFQDSLTGIGNLANTAQLSNSNDATRQRTALAKQYNDGAITYEKYQKKLTEITDKETLARLRIEKLELETQQALLLLRINKAGISENEKKDLIKQEEALNNEILKTGEAIEGVNAKVKQSSTSSFSDDINKIVTSYNTLTSAIVGFYKQVSEAQEASLNREISFQQTRVENARVLAERGNAQYLELEQKRLDELERKRAANAQKQLAIDNALRLSQATLAAISAIAQAVQTGNPFAAIAALAAVIGAISAAYNFVNSLQQPVAEFYAGTLSVEGQQGRDKIPAKLTRGEAVMPVKQNKAYSDAMAAIYYEKVPANIMNDFVKNYPGVHIEKVNYDRIGLAADQKINGLHHNRETITKLENIEHAISGLVETISSIEPVNIVMNENGFSVAITKHLRKLELLKRS